MEIKIKGLSLRYNFPNLGLVAAVEASGMGDEFKAKWEGAVRGDKESLAAIEKAWPTYVRLIIADPPDLILDIRNLTAGEVLAIANGFTKSAAEIREN